MANTDWKVEASSGGLGLDITQGTFEHGDTVEFTVRSEKPVTKKTVQSTNPKVHIAVNYQTEYQVVRRVDYISGGARVDFSEPQFVTATGVPVETAADDDLNLAEVSEVKKAKRRKQAAKRKAAK